MNPPSQTAETAPTALDWRNVVRGYCRLGATNEQLAALFGVPAATLAGWMATIPDFANAVRGGRLLADGTVAKSLWQLAVGYSHEEQRVLRDRDGPVTVSYTKHHPPHYKSCITWLSNRHPDKWGRVGARGSTRDAVEATDAFTAPCCHILRLSPTEAAVARSIG